MNYAEKYGELSDHWPGADDPGISGADVCGFSRQPLLGVGGVYRGLPDGFADGYIARHYHQVSDFGKFMDPLADKCLVMAALCCFVEQGDMLAWILAVVLVREFAVSGMRLVAVEKGRVIAAAWSGKIKTASTMVCICLILFGIPHWLNIVCQVIILVTTVYSGAEYFIKNADVFKESKEA